MVKDLKYPVIPCFVRNRLGHPFVKNYSFLVSDVWRATVLYPMFRESQYPGIPSIETYCTVSWYPMFRELQYPGIRCSENYSILVSLV
jgi:hypothetical protein